MTRAEISPLRKHIEESPKLRELRKKRYNTRRRMAILLSVLFCTIVGGLISAAHYPQLQLVNIVVEGNKVVDTEDVVAKTEALLKGNYAYVIPHRNAFFYPKKKIVADLLAAFPRFKSVVVYRTSLNTLYVSIEEVRGHALWCGVGVDTPDLSAPCYFTDEAGKIVAPAPYYSGNVYPRFFGGTLTQADVVSPLGKMFINESRFAALLSFEMEVKRLGLPVRAIIVGAGTNDMLLLDIGGGKTAELRFLDADNYQTLEKNLAAALGKAELANVIKTDLGNLQYFDLRFTNKVYYKFSDQ